MTLPEGWVETTIGDCSSTIQYGLTCTSALTGQGPRYVRITDIQNRQIVWESVPFANVCDDQAKPYFLQSGDLLFARTGATVGKSYLVKSVPFKAAFASYLIRVRCIDRFVIPEFAAFFFRTSAYWESISDGAEGTGQPNFNGSKLAALQIRVPPAAEQRRIVAKLDALTARLNLARAELDRVPVLAEALRRAAIAMTYLNASSWESMPFVQVLNYKGGSQPPKSTFHDTPGPGRIRLLQIRDFASDNKAVFIDDNGKWPRCNSDDIMVGRYGASVGKVLSGKGGAYNVALVKMTFDKALISPRYLHMWLRGPTFQDKLASVSRSAQDGFNKEDLAAIHFPLPPLDEQVRLVGKLDAAFARADRLEAEAARARALLDRLETAILARAFRGELVPQDPRDEPAAVLLDRIRAQRAAAPKPKRGRRGAVAA